MRRAHLLAPALLFLGCAWLSPSEGYSAMGTPSVDLDEAKSTCQSQSQFRDGNGQAFTDWNQFEKCMRDKGWEKNKG